MTLTTEPTNDLGLTLAGTIELAGAEIVSYDAATRRAYVTSGEGLSIVDLSDPSAPTLIALIDLARFGFTNNITSVAVSNGIVAVAVANDPKYEAGRVFLLDVDGHLLSTIEVGALPDHLSFTPDGSRILVANEGELDVDGTDAEGSVSIIDVSAGAQAATVITADFTQFNDQIDALKAAGVRLFAGTEGTQFENTTVAQDLEPEYIAVAPDGLTALVTLQEANSVAILDIATGTFTAIVPLGLKDFSSLLIDLSDRDGADGDAAINLQTGLPVFGQYMPDAIASYSAGGQTYYVIANEGDDRDDFLEDGETVRVGSSSYRLDDMKFDDAATLKGNAALGRLTVTNFSGLNGDLDGDGDIDQILAYGGRSFSILDAQGRIVFDSGDQIERFVASLGLVETDGVGFDDTRSDNKGAEPEGVSIAVIGGRAYAFVTLERSNGTMVYDVTDPADVRFVEFASNDGDVAPEIAKFVNAGDSATGQGLLLVANEGSNTLSIYQAAASDDDGVTRLSNRADLMNYGDGDQAVFGLGGNDRIGGGAGDDRLNGGVGDDFLVGNDGDDALYGELGDDRLGGLAGDDVIVGGRGNDVLRGGDGNDRLDGGAALDGLFGDAGDDLLIAGAGDDRVEGGDGDDVLIGGSGLDRLLGGAGADLFVFNAVSDSRNDARDRILDFDSAEGDRIDLSAIDADRTTDADDAFTVVDRFSNVAGELVLRDTGRGNILVLGDTNGDGQADFSFSVNGDAVVVASDFVL